MNFIGASCTFEWWKRFARKIEQCGLPAEKPGAHGKGYFRALVTDVGARGLPFPARGGRFGQVGRRKIVAMKQAGEWSGLSQEGVVGRKPVTLTPSGYHFHRLAVDDFGNTPELVYRVPIRITVSRGVHVRGPGPRMVGAFGLMIDNRITDFQTNHKRLHSVGLWYLVY